MHSISRKTKISFLRRLGTSCHRRLRRSQVRTKVLRRRCADVHRAPISSRNGDLRLLPAGCPALTVATASSVTAGANLCRPEFEIREDGGLARARTDSTGHISTGCCRWHPTSPAHPLTLAVQERIDSKALLQRGCPPQSSRLPQPLTRRRQRKSQAGGSSPGTTVTELWGLDAPQQVELYGGREYASRQPRHSRHSIPMQVATPGARGESGQRAPREARR